MGVVNVTPDSFSDGGRYLDHDQAVKHAVRLLDQGADVIDIGGESTRPGADPVPVDVELDRVLPVIERVLAVRPDALVSIDTTKAVVAREAVARGAVIINDVSAGRWDPEMPTVVAQSGAGYVIMHARSEPKTMQENVVYADVVGAVELFLQEQLQLWPSRGVCRNRLVLDPGIGFGKLVEHNLELIRAADRLGRLGRPVLWGLSRKSFIGKLTGAPETERLPGTLAAHAWLLAKTSAPQIWRVHDVAETVQFLKLWDALRTG
ncbi:MAG: dihydropteroate synthase [Candidatus Methylacidiphilales bacterium]